MSRQVRDSTVRLVGIVYLLWLAAMLVFVGFKAGKGIMLMGMFLAIGGLRRVLTGGWPFLVGLSVALGLLFAFGLATK